MVAPGNLFGSLLPALSVDGIKTAMKNKKAKVVMIANLVNKPTQTMGWHVVDYINEMELYIGNRIDYVLYNNRLPSKELLNKYAEDDELPLLIDMPTFKKHKTIFIGAPLVASNTHKQDPADKSIKRTLIRHDAKETVNQLRKLIINS